MKIYRIADRTLGKCITENGYKSPILLFRAVKHNVSEIKDMDYCTMSKKWAKEHAIHMAATEGEDFIVLQVVVDPKNVFEAYNPGELFYHGNPVRGINIFTAKAELYG